MASNPYVNKVDLADGTTLIDLTSDTVAADKMLYGITAHSKSGAAITGNIQSLGSSAYYPSTSVQTISGQQYLSGSQTIYPVITSGISAGNIKDGTTVKVGDTANLGRIHNVTGTFTDASTATSTHGAAAAGQILTGYSAWVDGAEVTGTFDMFQLTVAELMALNL